MTCIIENQINNHMAQIEESDARENACEKAVNELLNGEDFMSIVDNITVTVSDVIDQVQYDMEVNDFAIMLFKMSEGDESAIKSFDSAYQSAAEQLCKIQFGV